MEATAVTRPALAESVVPRGFYRQPAALFGLAPEPIKLRPRCARSAASREQRGTPTVARHCDRRALIRAHFTP